MNAVQFRHAMEEFARTRNIPLRDILIDIEKIGLESLTLSPEEAPLFFKHSYDMYCAGFPVPLPKGTRSVHEHDGSDSD